MRFAPGGAIRLKRTKKTDAQKKTKNGIKINMIDQICISTKKVKIKTNIRLIATAVIAIGTITLSITTADLFPHSGQK